MPLSFADIGHLNCIRAVKGNNHQKQHLNGLGFVPGSVVTVVSSLNGNLIVNVKGVRVALARELAAKIYI